MAPGQKLVDENGYEVALFPTQAMYLTEARNPPEHDVLALDFLPRDISGQRISPMPVFAPFSGTIVYTGNDHNAIFESDNPVHWADGTIAKMRVLVAHSFTQPTKGAHYNQGDLWYNTGNYGNSTGEHLHMEVARGEGRDWNSSGIGLNNAVHMWNALFVNNTVILRGGGYDWKEFKGGSSPEKKKKRKKFPWYLYSRKFRHDRR